VLLDYEYLALYKYTYSTAKRHNMHSSMYNIVQVQYKYLLLFVIPHSFSASASRQPHTDFFVAACDVARILIRSIFKKCSTIIIVCFQDPSFCCSRRRRSCCRNCNHCFCNCWRRKRRILSRKACLRGRWLAVVPREG
jgi:hypothetical protein